MSVALKVKRFLLLAAGLLLASLLLSACADQPATPTATPGDKLPAPSTPGVLVINTTPDALQSQIDQANQIPQQGPLIEATATPTRAPGPGPRLSATLPSLDTIPTTTTDPTTAKLLAAFTAQNITQDGKPEPLRALAFSPDRRLLVLADRFDTWLVETETGKLVQTLRGGANSLAWSPDGLLLASGGLNGVIIVWRWDKPTAKFRAGPNRLATSSQAEAFGDTVEVAFSPDSKKLAGFTSDGNISVYNTDTGLLQQAFTSEFAGYLSWSPDGTRLADEFLNLHTLATGQTDEPSYDIGLGGDGPQGVGWSPDGSLLAVSGDAFELLLAEAPAKGSVTTVQARVALRGNNTALKTPTVMPHLKEGRRVAWSPGGKWVAVANVPEAGKISVFDTTGRLLQTIPADQGPLRVLTWPTDGLLVSGGSDGSARFWQLTQ